MEKSRWFKEKAVRVPQKAFFSLDCRRIFLGIDSLDSVTISCFSHKVKSIMVKARAPLELVGWIQSRWQIPIEKRPIHREIVLGRYQ